LGRRKATNLTICNEKGKDGKIDIFQPFGTVLPVERDKAIRKHPGLHRAGAASA
jgi:hypothetical protein